MMRLLRAVVTVLFFAVTAVFMFCFINEKMTSDNTRPVINIAGDVLEVSVNDGDDVLLRDVTASDEKDGDLTDKLIVESISKFSEPGVCSVTYAVCDADKHVTSASRTIRYTDYVPPRFKLNTSLCYSVAGRVNVAGQVGAEDVLDGDISGSVVLTSGDFKSGTEGVFTLDAKVTNSKGDMSELEIPLIVEDRTATAPVILLTDYLIYTKKGEEVSYASYIEDVTDISGKPLELDVRVVSDHAPDKEGVYCVHYYATDENGRTGHSVLLIVVES